MSYLITLTRMTHFRMPFLSDETCYGQFTNTFEVQTQSIIATPFITRPEIVTAVLRIKCAQIVVSHVQSTLSHCHIKWNTTNIHQGKVKCSVTPTPKHFFIVYRISRGRQKVNCYQGLNPGILLPFRRFSDL